VIWGESDGGLIGEKRSIYSM